MKRFACLLAAMLGVLTLVGSAKADGLGNAHYGGYQPWWNIFAKRNKCMSAEEERLQRFWHDYYDSLRRYYGMLDRIDWVAYYKNHGTQINGGCGMGSCGGSSRIQYAPVIVTPGMQWAVPNGGGGFGAPACGPMGGFGGMPYGMPYGMPGQ